MKAPAPKRLVTSGVRGPPTRFYLRGWIVSPPTLQFSGRNRDNAPIQRRERRERLPQYVRRVKGDLFQVRIYLPEYAGPLTSRNINFGIFRSIGAAERASIKILKILARGKTPWEAMRELQSSGDLPASVLPTYVYSREGGYGARVGKRGQHGERVVLECPGPFNQAEAAYEAMAAEIKRWEAAHPDRPVKRAA